MKNDSEMKAKRKQQENKFEFDTDFQKDILQFTVTDKDGHKALFLYEDYFFTLLEHGVIAHALKKFYKTYGKVPRNKQVLKEQLRQLFQTRDYIDSLQVNDRKAIVKIVDDLYTGPVKDGEALLESCKKFARYTQLKHITEDFDLTDFGQYDVFSKKIQNAITFGREVERQSGTFLVQDVYSRQLERKLNDVIVPTPFWQFNRSTNAGGYERHSLICIIGPEKEFKTGTLVNIGRGYMRHKKKVIVFDLENGYNPYATRYEQALTNKSKREILSGQFDDDLKRIIRKYRRFGAEVRIERMPAMSTTIDFQVKLDELYAEHGIKFDIGIFDYVGNMGATSGQQDDFNRISGATLDLKNFLEYNDFECGYTAMHVVRDASKRFATKFQTLDIAKCIDIPRHVDALWGLQQSEEEAEGGVIRMEIIDQRDGPQDMSAYFWVNKDHQRMDEFSKKQIETYRQEIRAAAAGRDKDKKAKKGESDDLS
jgi:hypothetical protein